MLIGEYRLRTTTLVTRNQREAIRLLGVHTNGRYDVDMLTGDGMADVRAAIMSAINGAKTPKSKSGWGVVRDALLAINPHNANGDCHAERRARLGTDLLNSPITTYDDSAQIRRKIIFRHLTHRDNLILFVHRPTGLQVGGLVKTRGVSDERDRTFQRHLRRDLLLGRRCGIESDRDPPEAR